MDFILSKIDEEGNEISEGELRKAMLEISDRYGGSTALETSEGRYINKEGVKKTEKILSLNRIFLIISANSKDDLIKKKS
jgi:hypothetical protein